MCKNFEDSRCVSALNECIESDNHNWYLGSTFKGKNSFMTFREHGVNVNFSTK